ncbi:MAG: hypothetical protein GX595_21155 [Lentisphaerae bacterium]|nr:hypothetical protein [Lentisphaerota bacterium]
MVSATSASPSGLELDRLLAELINTANTTHYDKAIDAAYLATHVGGSRLHHLLDGQHDLAGAFAAARAAVPDDSTAAAVLGTARHLVKDLFSVMGLPLVSLAPESYRAASSWMQTHLGISKAWQADLLQINAMDVFGGALTVAAVVMGVDRADSEALVEIAAGSGLAGLAGANPLALLAAAVALAAAWRLRTRGESWTPELRHAAVAVASSGAAIGTGAALANVASGGLLALLVSLALSLAAGVVVRGVLRGLGPRAGQSRGDARAFAAEGDSAAQAWLRHLEQALGPLTSALDQEALGILRRSLA